MTHAAIDEAWPADGLEQLGQCPLCANTSRALLHDGLQDWAFRAAPGRWTMHACMACDAAYLDPRPSPASIHRAYQTYYTHGGAPVAVPRPGIAERVKAALANDYSRARFGLDEGPSIPGGRILARLFPSLARSRNIMMRFLPKPGAGRNRLLDVGSGDSIFLKRAARAGWIACGVEPDPAARAANLQFDVRPTLEEWSGATFDAVTLNHSIEHIHDPAAAMRAIHALMQPGATLFIDTPNADSLGHAHFGKYWRGLEAPRHLVLFKAANLRALLEQAGFVDIAFVDRPSVLPAMNDMSRRISAGLDPEGGEPMPADAMAPPREAEREDPSRREFLTVTARRGPA